MQARELVTGIPTEALRTQESPRLDAPIKGIDESGNEYEVTGIAYDPENKCFYLHLLGL